MGLILAIGAIAAAPAQNPLARAEAGEAQCYRPDAARKTCQSIASYIRTGDRSYDEKIIVALSNDATLETHTRAVLRGPAVCSYLRSEDMLAGVISLKGRLLSPDAAKPVLEKIAGSVSPLAGKEICTRYEPSAGDIIAKVSIGGAYRPDQDVTIRWIGSSEGYTVTP